MAKYDKYIYDLSIEKTLKGRLEQLIKENELVERWSNLNKIFHNLDFFVDELCPGLRSCENDEELKKELQKYINKLDFLSDYGFDKVGLLFDITGRLEVSNCIYSNDLISMNGDKKESVKTFTDGKKENQKYIMHGWEGMYSVDDYIINIESKLVEPSYWFNVHYFFNDDAFYVVDKIIKVKDLDFDFSLLPTLNDLENYKLDYDCDGHIYEEIVSDWFDKGKVKTK